uniref:IF rod domain-containing protein n=1 Tax=Electrophorus electricus TaxID=8005 RepID=A0AAY5F3V5_ELEEL
MSRNSARSMYGGAGGQGAKASVSSMEGLRNALRPEGQQQQQLQHPQRNSPYVLNTPPAATPVENKKTMGDLNQRLSGYLDRKRGQTTSRDWEDIEKPLEDLRKQISDMTMENARLLLEADNNKMANEDLKNKLEMDRNARHMVEQDLAELCQLIDDIQLIHNDLEGQIDSVKEELAYLKKDHCDDVAALEEKIKESNVVVETDSSQSNLNETINKIRMQYEKIAVKNREETDEWYRTKFEDIKVEVSKKTESLQSSMTELNKDRKQKQQYEIEAQELRNMVNHDFGGHAEQRTGSFWRQRQKQTEAHQDLLNVKMELEAKITEYRNLMKDVDPR